MRAAWTDNVPNDLSGARGSDPASWQHVNFAALALGTEGTLPATSPTTTEAAIEGGTLNWPKVVGPPACVGAACVSNTKQPNPTGVDDLWHAAVNGRGAFVNASNAKELRNGMEQILNGILQVGGARTGSSNPNPNFSSTNNFIYTVRFEGGLGRFGAEDPGRSEHWHSVGLSAQSDMGGRQSAHRSGDRRRYAVVHASATS